MSVCIGITSGKGGVGKSSVCIGLGIVLAKAKNRVCLVDMDLGLKNLDMMMGLENRVYFDLLDVYEGRCLLKQALVRDKHESELMLLPACKTIHVQKFKGEMLFDILDELKTQFDYIIFDTPAGIETGFQHTLTCCDHFIVVSTLDTAALQDADRIIGLLMKENVNHIQCILNRINQRYIDKGISVELEKALEWLSVECLGMIYDDEQLMKGNNQGRPIVLNERSKAWGCFMQIKSRLLQENIEDSRIKSKSILRKFFFS